MLCTTLDKDKKPTKETKVLKVFTHTGQKCNVDQSFKDSMDINKLLEKAQRDGLIRHGVKFEGEYDDIAAEDFQTAQFAVAKANTMFETLPSTMRNRFGTTEKFLQWAQNPNNANEMQKLGILKGNDGLTTEGKPSGAPTTKDKDGNGIADSTETAAAPAQTA